jgi:hypothetical protein
MKQLQLKCGYNFQKKNRPREIGFTWFQYESVSYYITDKSVSYNPK